MKPSYPLLFVLLICCVFNVTAQHDCGTIATPDPNFNEDAYREFIRQREGQLRAVEEKPVQLHILRSSDGTTSAFTDQQVLDRLAATNMHFEQANLKFVLCGDINYIDSDEYYSIDNFTEANTLYDLHKVDDVINIFFAANTLGRCGYSTFPWSTYQWILVSSACPNNLSNLTHEIGHWYGLYHTHETAFGNELVDGSNCGTAGDRLCDTEADPTIGGLVNNNCVYTGSAVDANGDPYDPNPRNIMSYANSICRDFFSSEQIARIDFYNNNGRENLTCDDTPSTCPPSIPGYTSLGEYNNSKYFLSDNSATWAAAQTATSSITDAYLVSINDQAENDFIEGLVGSNIYFIGLSDAQNEGTLTWDSGDPVNFDNSTGNSASGDFGVMYFWDGKWGFDGGDVWRKYIIEVPCSITPPGGELTLDFCPPDDSIAYYPNATGPVIITWPDLPMASTTCTDGVVNIEQTGGPLRDSDQVIVGTAYTITYTITDNCGNTETCSFVITPYRDPITSNLQCPDDISVVADPGALGATVNWDENDITGCGVVTRTQIGGLPNGSFFPIGTSTITYEVYGNCFPLFYTEECSFTITVTGSGGPCPTDIPGFTVLGEYNNSKYFLSDNSATWPDAKAAAANTNGGYLVSINDQAENDFIESQVGSKIYFIGLSDAQTEGDLTWDSGEAVSFDNSGGNSGANDYGVFYFWDGSWGFEGGSVWRKYIMEVPCGSNPPGGILSINSCSDDVVIGVPFGAQGLRIISFPEPTASTTCSDGIVSIVQTEGPQNGTSVPQSTYTITFEITDNCGNTATCSFEVSFTTIPPNVSLQCPDDIELTVAVGEMGATVFWDENDFTLIGPCVVNSLTQIGGPANGSFFPIGTTTITYEANGNCNAYEFTRTCSFDIIINGSGGPCPSDITGFTSLGEYNNSKYYLSNNSATWDNAQTAASTAGGYLVSINDQAENDFIESVVGNKIYFIGLSDAQTEGDLTWDSGEAVSFDNSGGNSGSNDFGVFYFWDGSWGFDGGSVWRKYIVEIPCGSTPNDGPDLQLSNVHGFPNSAIQGEVVDYIFDLENIGTEIALGDYVIGAYLSSDRVFSPDDELAGVVNTGNTAVGTITDIPAAITIPLDLAPSQYYYLILVADINSDITELEEDNNVVVASPVITIAVYLDNPCVVYENSYGSGFITCTELLPSGDLRIVYWSGTAYLEKIIATNGDEISDTPYEVSQASIKIVDNKIVETDFDGIPMTTTPIDPALVALFDVDYKGFCGVDRAEDGGFFLCTFEKIFDAPLPSTSGTDQVYLYKLNSSGLAVNNVSVDQLGSYNVFYSVGEQVLATPDGGVELYYQQGGSSAYVYRYTYDANLAEVKPRETVAFANGIYSSFYFGEIVESPCANDQYIFDYINVFSSSPHGGTTQGISAITKYDTNGKSGILSRSSMVTSVQGFGSRSDVLSRRNEDGTSLQLNYSSVNAPSPLLPDSFLLQWVDELDQVQKEEDQVLNYFPKDLYELADGSVVFIGERNGEIYLTNVDCGTVNRHQIETELVESDNKIKVFPNPVIDEDLNVIIKADAAQSNVLVKVFDSRGTLQLSRQVNLQEGINQFNLEIQELTGGMYYLLLPQLHSKKNSAPFLKIRD